MGYGVESAITYLVVNALIGNTYVIESIRLYLSGYSPSEIEPILARRYSRRIKITKYMCRGYASRFLKSLRHDVRLAKEVIDAFSKVVSEEPIPQIITKVNGTYCCLLCSKVNEEQIHIVSTDVPPFNHVMRKHSDIVRRYVSKVLEVLMNGRRKEEKNH